jgi:DNA-binding Lrp family transcriptional regulator
MDTHGMDKHDATLLTRVQSGLPVERRPFRRVGEELGMPEREVVERLRRLKASGLIRRMGATFEPGPLGYVSTLAGMQVPAERLEALAAFVGRFPEVTHSYERDGAWNLWFTLTAASAGRLEAVLEAIRAEGRGCRLVSVPTRKRYKLRVEFDLVHEEPGFRADR